MKPENKAFLETNEHYWLTLRDAGYMKGLDGGTRSGFARVINEEFQPGYATDMWCPPCVADMIQLTYRYFNEWREKNPPAPVVDELHTRKAEMIREAMLNTDYVPGLLPPASTAQEDFSEPAPEPEPARISQIKANFPKHHNRKRR